jgi:hypothetical protein
VSTTTPTKLTKDQKIDALATMFFEANEAAKAADPGAEEDNRGSSNLDTPAFRVDGTTKATIEAAAALSGVAVTEFKWLGGRKWFWLNVEMHGQGHRRTTMMEAAQAVIQRWKDEGKIPGLVSCGYQQAD